MGLRGDLTPVKVPKHDSRPKPQRKEQLERFRETARDLGCDEDQEALERAARRIARPKERMAIVDKVKQKSNRQPICSFLASLGPTERIEFR
jgi:hypothetical protein